MEAVLTCALRYVGFIVPVALCLVVLRVAVRPPRDMFRKLLHAAAFSSAPAIMRFAEGSWQVAVATLALVGAAIWPLLALAERWPKYGDLFVEKGLHEVRRSMLLLFWGNAAVVALCWGAFGQARVAVASILMWGTGDAAAALVGRRWGMHKVQLPLADHAKSWEGTLACAGVALAAGLAVNAAFGVPFTWGLLARTALAATLGAYVELITKGGYDTITVPAAVAAVLLALR